VKHDFSPVEAALEAIAAGKVVIVLDAEDRENEGDFICGAEKVTPEIVHFMISQGRGQLCMPVLPEIAHRLDLVPLVEKNTTRTQTPYLIPVDHRECRTGISPEERARTIRAIADPESVPEDFVRPGHLSPLLAKEGGVLRRAGHTEATVDLARLAGLTPAGILCEICSRDGRGMARRDELMHIAQEFDLPIITIEEFIRFRRRTEKLVYREAESELLTRYGQGRILAYRIAHEEQAPVALVLGDPAKRAAPLVRMHSSCFTGDLLSSLRCDCGDQLKLSLEMMSREGAGVLVYLPQEGRGIGLIEKLKAYELQDKGMDTVEANLALGFQADMRDYGVGVQILKDLGLTKVRLLTNNPKKTEAINFLYHSFDLEVVDQVPIIAPSEPHRAHYLATKRDKLGHQLPAE
jgi:3,4-dihydroxy 2-butanone 4-phosphate synthase/GTP cyclohydrolase II